MAKTAKRKDSISAVSAREILDSRGQPTVEVEVELSSGIIGRAAVPSGASTGEHEAVELRDGDARRFAGKGTLKAVENVKKSLSKVVIGKDPCEQQEVDQAMISLDGTSNKGKLGANAILGVSMAVSRAAAASCKMPLYRYLREAFGLKLGGYLLPTPMFNVINGGRHADSGLDVQEFMIVPVGAPSFKEALRLGAETYHVLKKVLAAMKESTAVGDEGGFAPHLRTHEEVLAVLMNSIRESGYEKQASLALDVAASEFYRSGKYKFGGVMLSGAELAEKYRQWCERHPIVSIEDPFDQDDWDSWRQFTAGAGARIRIIGDDLFVTNVSRLERGIRDHSANAILIKLNQIGSVTETVQAVLMAQKNGFSAVISHRSGETEDPYIADLAVALNAGAIKTGAPCRSERLAKYNQLLRIEAELGAKADYAGRQAFHLASPKSARSILKV